MSHVGQTPSRSTLDWLYERFLEVFVYSSVWAAGGLFALTVFSSRMLGLGWSIQPGLLVLFSCLFIYNLDHVIDTRVQRIPDREAHDYFNRPAVLVLLVASAVLTGLLVGGAPLAAKIVFAIYTVIGLVYGLPLFPRWGGTKARLKDVPMLKSWLVGGTVTLGVVGLPAAWAGRWVWPDIGFLGLFMGVFVVPTSTCSTSGIWRRTGRTGSPHCRSCSACGGPSWPSSR